MGKGKNKSAIIFRRWVDGCRFICADKFKIIMLALFDYIFDDVKPKQLPVDIQPIVSFMISEFDEYREWKQKDALRKEEWKKRKQEEIGKDVTSAEKTGKDITSAYKTGTGTGTAKETSTAIVTETNYSSLSPCVCVSRDACAQARENTHTQEEALPEGLVLTKEQIEEIKRRWPSDWQARLSKFASRLSAGYVVSDQYSTLIKWAEEDDERMRRRNAGKVSASGRSGGGHPGSFDTDDFVKAAMNRNFDDM